MKKLLLILGLTAGAAAFGQGVEGIDVRGDSEIVLTDNGSTPASIEIVSADDIFVAAGGKIDAATSAASIRIGRDLTVNGNILSGQSKVTFYGNQNATISIASTDKLFDVEVNKLSTALATVNGTTGVSNSLAVSNGTLNLNDASTLMLDAGKTISVTGGAVQAGFVLTKPQIIADTTSSTGAVIMNFAAGSRVSINGLTMKGVQMQLQHDTVIDADGDGNEDRVISKVDFDNIPGANNAVPATYIDVVSFPGAGSSTVKVRGCTFENAAGLGSAFNISTPAGSDPSNLLVDAGWVNTGAWTGAARENDHGTGIDSGATSTIKWVTNPGNLSPGAWTFTADNNAQLSWGILTDSLNYEIQYSTDLASWTSLSITPGQNVNLPNLAPGFYYWRVRGIDFLGNVSSWSQILSIGVDPPPVLVSPNDGAITNDNTPDMKWTPWPNAGTAGISYEIQIGPDTATLSEPNGLDTITYQATVGAFGAPQPDPVVHTVAAALLDGTYKWTVRAVDAANNKTIWANTWTFKVDTVGPAAPTLVSPPDGAVLSNPSVTFTWTPVTDPGGSGVFYRLEVDELGDNFASPIVVDPVPGVNPSDYTLPTALSNGTYSWRMLAKDGAGNASGYSATNGFIVNAGGASFLTVGLGPNSPPDSNQSNIALNVPVMQLRFSAVSEDVKVTSVTFTALGTGNDATDITAVRLYADTNSNGTVDGTDTLLGTAIYAVDDGTVKYSGLGFIVPAGQFRDMLLTYNFNGSPGIIGNTYRARVAVAADISAQGVSSGNPIAASGVYPINSGNITIVGGGATGAINVTKGAQSPPDKFVLANQSVVSIVQVQIQVSSVEGVTLQTMTFHAGGTGNDLTEISNVYLMRDINNNGKFDAGTDSVLVAIASGQPGFPTADNGDITFTGINFSMNVSTTSYLLLVYDFNGTAVPGETFFASTTPAADVAATGNTSGNFVTIQGSSFSSSLITIATPGGGAAGTVSVDPYNFTPGSTEVAAYAHNIPMVKIIVSADPFENVVLKKLTFKASGGGDDRSDVSQATLVEDVDGDFEFTDFDRVVALIDRPYSINDGEASITVNDIIAAGTSRRYMFLYNFSGLGATGGSFSVSLDPSVHVLASGLSSGLDLVVTGGIVNGPTYSLAPLIGSEGRDVTKSCLKSTNGGTPGRDSGAMIFVLLLAACATIARIYAKSRA